MLLQIPGTDRTIRVACKECIYGHRAPTCGHLSKVLVEVRVPGRPRVHCSHGKSYEGVDRCKVCFPATAFVVPGHRAKIGKCQCHKDPKAPITDAKKAPQEIAEAHEDARQQAKELRKLRATKGFLPEDFASSSPRRSRAAAQSTKQEEPESQRADSDQTERALQAHGAVQGPVTRGSCCQPPLSNITSKRGSCCQPAEPVEDRESAAAAKRQKVLHVRPWPEPLEQQSNIPQDSDHCHCAPGACTCVGCSDHPENEATMKVVEELWRAQFPECYQPQSVPIPPSGFAYAGTPVTMQARSQSCCERSTAYSSSSQPPQNAQSFQPRYSLPTAAVTGDTSIDPVAIPQSPALYGSDLHSHHPLVSNAHPGQRSLLTQPVDPSVMEVHTEALRWIENIHRSTYQAYTLINDCLNPECMCGVGCLCQGCCTHLGHGDLSGSTGLFFEDGSVEYNPPYLPVEASPLYSSTQTYPPQALREPQSAAQEHG